MILDHTSQSFTSWNSILLSVNMRPEEDFIELITAIDTQNLRKLRINVNKCHIDWWVIFSRIISQCAKQFTCPFIKRFWARRNFSGERKSLVTIHFIHKSASLRWWILNALTGLLIEMFHQNQNIGSLSEIKYWADDGKLNNNTNTITPIQIASGSKFNAVANLKDVSLKSSTPRQHHLQKSAKFPAKINEITRRFAKRQSAGGSAFNYYLILINFIQLNDSFVLI